MAANRCSNCNTNWPLGAAYKPTCPECGEPTAYFQNAQPIEAGEAASRRKHAEFERYFAEREERQRAELASYDPERIGDDVEAALRSETGP